MATANRASILDVIQKYAPRPYRTSGGRHTMSCPVPGHEDRNPSFTVNAEGTWGTCWSRCGGFSAHSLEELFTSGHAFEPPGPAVSQKSTAPQELKEREPLQGACLKDLVKEKGLDLDFVKSLGWRDHTLYGHVPTVRMPIRDITGNVSFHRYRVGLTSKVKVHSEKGATVTLIGLENLETIRKGGRVVLVEGETDFAALLFHGIPVLALPGSSTVWRNSWAEHLAGLEVFPWKEPDQAGKELINTLAQSILGLKVITPPPGIKDACELAQLHQSDTVTMMAGLMEGATPAPAPAQRTGASAPPKEDDANQGAFPGTGTLHFNEDPRRQSIIGPLTHGPLGYPVQGYHPPRSTEALVADSLYYQCHKNAHFKLKPKAGESKITIDDTSMQLITLSHYFAHVKDFERLQPKVRHELFNHTEYLATHFCGFMFENPNLWTEKEDRVAWLINADGEWEKQNPLDGLPPKRNSKVVNEEHCLETGNKTCADHGHRRRSVSYCGGKHCPDSGSSQSRDLARIKLPYPEDGQGYRMVWVRKAISTTGSIQGDAYAIRRECKALIKAGGSRLGGKIKHRKGKGHAELLHRAAGFHLKGEEIAIHLKLTFWQDQKGGIDADIARLADEWGGEIVWQNTTVIPETAQLHMVGAATATLYSVDPDNQLTYGERADLFLAYWEGTKGEKLNMPMGFVSDLISDLKELPEDLCLKDGCQLKLYWEPLPQPDPNTAGFYATDPLSQDYAYAEYAQVRG